ncbi:MAG TPA: VC0807 family protein [Ktedonobacteraceae bacterium]|nr:VC0807 family protein [Ktedonobacteraceae bacterium]
MTNPPSSVEVANMGRAIKSNVIRSLLISVVINGAFPLVIYWALTTYDPAISPFVALVASGIPSLIHSMMGLVRRRRIDFLAGIALIAIVISLIITALGGDPKIYLIRESFFTVAFGLVLLVSLALPRPFMFYMARHFAAGNNSANVAHFDLLWQQDERLRRRMRLLTAVWGAGFLLEAAIRITLVLTLSTEQFLAVSPFVIYGILAVLVIWTLSRGRGSRKGNAEPARSMDTEEQPL